MQLSIQGRIALFLYSLFLAMLLCSIPLRAADVTGYTILSSTSEVRLAFAASDRQGHAIKTLLPADVAVSDNGAIIRHFRSFRPASETPLDLVILLDASDSVAAQIPREIAEVQDFIANSPWGEHDRISILAFGGTEPRLICARNCHAEIAQFKLASLRASGATPLYDALVKATDLLKQDRDPQSRPALILFSDGLDTISINSVPDVLQSAQNLQSAIYSVNSRSKKSAPNQGDAILDYLSANTGGLSFAPGQDATQLLHSILEDLHSGYVLTYDLPQQFAGQHRVQLLPTRDPKLQFRSRLAYNDSSDQ